MTRKTTYVCYINFQCPTSRACVFSYGDILLLHASHVSETHADFDR